MFPSEDRPPRWARGLVGKATASPSLESASDEQEVQRVMERLHNLETLVKELSSQLKESQAVNSSAGGSSSGVGSPDSHTTFPDVENQGRNPSVSNITSVDNQFGRLVVQNANHSRYVSSGFWSRINDEVRSATVETYLDSLLTLDKVEWT